MEAAPRCITIKVYRNKILLETKRYANPPKPAGDILDRLRDIQMVGDLRHGDLLLSASDMLGGAATYELHLKPGLKDPTANWDPLYLQNIWDMGFRSMHYALLPSLPSLGCSWIVEQVDLLTPLNLTAEKLREETLLEFFNLGRGTPGSKPSSTAQEDTIARYGAAHGNLLWCPVIVGPVPRCQAQAGHLFQRGWFGKASSLQDKLLDMFDLEGVDDPKNMLIMHAGVEELFDRGELVILQEGPDTYRAKIIKKERLEDHTPLESIANRQRDKQVLWVAGDLKDPLPGDPPSFAQLEAHHLDGRTLRFSNPARPSKRCLGEHARICVWMAEKNAWIPHGSITLGEFAWEAPTDTPAKRAAVTQWLAGTPTSGDLMMAP